MNNHSSIKITVLKPKARANRGSSADLARFRKALLEYRPSEEWAKTRIVPPNFIFRKMEFEGKKMYWAELAQLFVDMFPSKEKYGTLSTISRMLNSCGIKPFSYLERDNLRGFLFSAKTEEEWKTWMRNLKEFLAFRMQFRDNRISGQMLLIHCGTELSNRETGKFYSVTDYRVGGIEPVIGLHRLELLERILMLADIQTLQKMSDIKLTVDVLRETLLSAKTREEWKDWVGDNRQFENLIFSLPGAGSVTGRNLLSLYLKVYPLLMENRVNDMFERAGLERGTSEAARRDRNKQMFVVSYPTDVTEPGVLKDILLQVCSREEWKTAPLGHSELRKKQVLFGGKKNAFSSILHIYSSWKLRKQQEESGDCSFETFSLMQKDEALKKQLKINTDTVKEMLEAAGIEYHPGMGKTLTDIDLLSGHELREILKTAKLNGRDVDLSCEKYAITDFRKLRMVHPETGIQVTGHSLMLYFSVMKEVSENPQCGLKVSDAPNKGKSNNSIMNEIISLAGF